MWWGYQHLRHVMIDRFGSSLFATSWPGRCKSVSEGEEASNRGTCPAMAKCQRSSLVRKHGSIDWVNSCRRRTLGYAVSLFELGDHIGVFFNQFSLWSCSCNDKSQWQLREKRGGPKGGYGEECDWRAILWKVSSIILACMNVFASSCWSLGGLWGPAAWIHSLIYLKWDVAGCLLLLVNVILTGYVLATVLLCCSNQVPAGCAAAVDTTEQVQWLRFWQPFFRHLGHL